MQVFLFGSLNEAAHSNDLGIVKNFEVLCKHNYINANERVEIELRSALTSALYGG
jgi:hypothetical protein